PAGRLDLVLHSDSPTFSILHTRSTDGGFTWSPAGPLPSNRSAALAVSAPGTLAVAGTDAGSQLSVFVSSDGGSTWNPPVVLVAGSNPPPVALAWTGPMALLACWSD